MRSTIKIKHTVYRLTVMTNAIMSVITLQVNV